MKKITRALNLEDINDLRASVQRRNFDETECLSVVEGVSKASTNLLNAIEYFRDHHSNWKRDPYQGEWSQLFSLWRPDSSLKSLRLDWKMSLSERISTETLARHLNFGGSNDRVNRITAFLLALGFKDHEIGAQHGPLISAKVSAEVPALDGRRMDLEIVWVDTKRKEYVLVIEAKFEHKITEGQLDCYYRTVKQAHSRNTCQYFMVLALSDKVMSSVSHREKKWRFCSWRDLWLRFEERRPVEYNISFLMFLHALWHRVGCLNETEANAAL